MTILTENQVQEIELFYKPVDFTKYPQITSSKDAFNVLKYIWNPNKICYFEEFKVIYLNQSSRVLGVKTISQGGISGTVVDIRIIMQNAIKVNATSIILSHNHPSGALNPSSADRNVTKKIKEAGDILDIRVFDHIIITSESYFSFADEGLL